MLLLSYDALLLCDHTTGRVENQASQRWVTITDRPVLVAPDPVGRSIKTCPNYGAGITACLVTLDVKKGYSSFVRIDGHPICLDTVTGSTNGSPGAFKYSVKNPGQAFVRSSS